MRELRLGDVTFESTKRAGTSKIHLPVYGVNRSEGLTPDAKYKSATLERYKVLNPGSFAYNPMRLNIGSIAYCSFDHSPGLVSPDYVVFGCDSEKLDPDFMSYLIKGPQWRQWTNAAGVGSVRVRIYFRELARMQLRVPPLAEQRTITELLGALDKKIELNRQMNETLEAIARALFQSWFVDFSPIRVKQGGRIPIGIDETTAAFFPAKFKDSELGEIPEGWSVRPLYDLAKFVNGAAFKTADFCASNQGLPVVKIGELKAGISAQTKFSARKLATDQTIETGDLLYSWSGTPDTSLDAFLWSHGSGLLNQHIFKVVTRNESEERFLYYLLKYLRPRLVEIARNKQTTGLGHVTVADMKRLYVCWPSNDILKSFDKLIAPIFDRAFANTLESQTLAAIRDTLLPKLLSGSITVP